MTPDGTEYGAIITIDGNRYFWWDESWAREGHTPDIVLIAAGSGVNGLIIHIPGFEGAYEAQGRFPGIGVQYGGVVYTSDGSTGSITLETFDETMASGRFEGVLHDDDGVVAEPIVILGNFTVLRVYDEPDAIP